MLLLHSFTLNNKNNERLTGELSFPTGGLFTLAKLQVAVGAY